MEARKRVRLIEKEYDIIMRNHELEYNEIKNRAININKSKCKKKLKAWLQYHTQWYK